jgi:hypothetical protein
MIAGEALAKRWSFAFSADLRGSWQYDQLFTREFKLVDGQRWRVYRRERRRSWSE